MFTTFIKICKLFCGIIIHNFFLILIPIHFKNKKVLYNFFLQELQQKVERNNTNTF